VLTDSPALLVYGADWCRDCLRTKRQLDGLGIGYAYIDVEHVDGAADEAQAISGRMNIPVVVYPDGTHHVEPADADVAAKLRELGLLGEPLSA
jgi:Glutaredoxin and related proteins